MSKKSQIVCAFIFGCIFVSALLVLAMFVPTPTPFQYQTFRVVMALASAGVAAMIPGFLKVDFRPSVKLIVRAGGALAVFVVVYFFNPAKLSAHSDDKAGIQSAQDMTGSPAGMQAGRDINVYGTSLSPQSVISSVALEFRMTCTLKEKPEIPPGEVPYVPVGGGVSYLHGPGGDVPLKVESPVRFRLQTDNKVVVVNRYVMSNGEDLIKRPVESLLSFTNLEANVITVVYGSAFARIKRFETTIAINGQDVWYGSWNYDADFTNTGGVTFQIPLADFHKKLTAK